jgi:hypothetical protein
MTLVFYLVFDLVLILVLALVLAHFQRGPGLGPRPGQGQRQEQRVLGLLDVGNSQVLLQLPIHVSQGILATGLDLT